MQYLDNIVIIYLDGILKYRDNKLEHVNLVRKVLEIFRMNNLYAKKCKSTLGVFETEYLGFIFKGDGVAISPHKTISIESRTIRGSAKDVQSFLGLIN